MQKSRQETAEGTGEQGMPSEALGEKPTEMLEEKPKDPIVESEVRHSQVQFRAAEGSMGMITPYLLKTKLLQLQLAKI